MGQKGAYEILGAKVNKTKDGLIEVEMPPKKEAKPRDESESEEKPLNKGGRPKKVEKTENEGETA